MKVIKHKDKWYLQSDTGYKEILLSTDELLIKDGIQSINDEFLEWFVKNPSCESVKVLRCPIEGLYTIIPKEEQKQHLIDMMKSDEELGLYDEPKTKCYCGHTTYCDCGPEEPKQETLEEAAREYWKRGQFGLEKAADTERAFLRGANWQAERMYSEEEVNEIIAEAWNSCEDNESDETFTQARQKILEQFKKK